jgi:hypothetical protein
MIQACAKELHQRWQHLIPFSKVDCQLGEMYQFNYEKMSFLLSHFSLHEQEGKNVALILIKQVVPCIMHTENHLGEKIITVLVSIGAAKL